MGQRTRTVSEKTYVYKEGLWLSRDFGFLQVMSSNGLILKDLLADTFMRVQVFTQMVVCLALLHGWSSGLCLSSLGSSVHHVCLTPLPQQMDFRNPERFVNYIW